MFTKTYKPNPIDTSSVDIPANLQDLVEQLAKHVHASWAKKRIEDGWQWGQERDDKKKLHPDLVPYDELPEEEKQYDRQTAKETLKVVLQSGYQIKKNSTL
jgi:ryanodine receptor 2